MSLSRLERLQEQAEEERLSKLRAKQALESTDETKRRKKLIEEEQEQTRFAYKGTPLPASSSHMAPVLPPAARPLIALVSPPSSAALQDNIWYYRDRAGLPRGPCQLSTLRAGWVNGVIDEFTLVWGQGLEAWYPVRNVISLVANIQSYDGEKSTQPRRFRAAMAVVGYFCGAAHRRDSEARGTVSRSLQYHCLIGSDSFLRTPQFSS